MLAASTLTSVSYLVPASVVASLTIWIGRKRAVVWSFWEPLLVSLPFLMVYLYVWAAHGSIRDGVVEMGFHPFAVVMIAGLGGFLAGLSLLPRLLYRSGEIPGPMITAISAFLIGLLCLKMFALMAAIANPKAFISPDRLSGPAELFFRPIGGRNLTG